jgi:hypothetical protein
MSMDPEIATAVAVGIAVVGFVVWLFALQMMQAIHFVWPPFLFAQLSRQPVKAIRSQFEALVNNLPYG